MGRQISVSEAAARLGVTPHRVRQRIADGSMPAERVGNRWGIDEADLLPLLDGGKVGRPLSERSAWAILDYADSSPQALAALALLAPSERRRTEERWRFITAHAWDTDTIADVARLLREMLAKRAERQVFRANTLDLPDLRADARLVLSGLNDPRAEIAAGDIVEGYVTHADLEHLIRDYLLTPAVGESSRQQANVVLHASVRSVPRPAPLLLVAADLADHRTPREESRAIEILNDLTATEQIWHDLGTDQ
jgi:excisionase family DNA binding protein